MKATLELAPEIQAQVGAALPTSSARKGLLPAVSWLFIATTCDQFLVSFANFALVVLVGRFLGPSDLGTFTLVWSVALFLWVVQQSFIVAPMLTFRSKYDGSEQKSYFGGIVKTQLVFAGAASTAVFVVFHFVSRVSAVPDNVSDCALPLAFCCASFQMQEACRRLLQACKCAILPLLSDVIAYGTQATILALILLHHRIAISTVLWLMCGSWCMGSLFFLSLRRRINLRSSSFTSTVRAHLNFGAALAASNLFQWFGAYGALYIAAAGLSTVAVGNIRAVINIVAPVNVFALGVQTFISIEAAEIFRDGGWSAMKDFLSTAAKRFLVAGLSGGVIFALFAKKLLPLLFGPAFSVRPVWVVVAFVQVLMGALFGFVIIYFKTVERTSLAAISAALATFISLVFTALLLTRLATGAVFVGLVINQLCALVLGITLAKLKSSPTIACDFEY